MNNNSRVRKLIGDFQVLRTTSPKSRTLFGRQVRLNCENGRIPIVAMPLYNKRQILGEVAAVLQANYTLDFQLECSDVTRYDNSAISQKTAMKMTQLLCDRGLATPEQAVVALSSYDGSADGVLGPNEVCMLREWPRVSQNVHRLLATRKSTDIPSNIRDLLLKSYHAMLESGEGINPETKLPEITDDEWCIMHYYSSLDQFNELLLNLRDRVPGRYLLSTFNPEYEHVPEFDPDVNAMLARSGKNNDPVVIQCFVDENLVLNDKPALTMRLVLSQLNVTDINYITAIYGILMQAIAHVTQLSPYELLLDIGEVTLPDLADENTVDDWFLQLYNPDDPVSTFSLSPEMDDLYKLSFSQLMNAFIYPMENENAPEEN